jgi:hypothetical protein
MLTQMGYPLPRDATKKLSCLLYRKMPQVIVNSVNNFPRLIGSFFHLTFLALPSLYHDKAPHVEAFS